MNNDGATHRHKKSDKYYTLIVIANSKAKDPQSWPTTAVYRECTGERRVFARPMNEFADKFEEI